MTRVPRVFRWAMRLVPSRWRESVARDLLEESMRSGRRGPSATWLTVHALAVAAHLGVRAAADWCRRLPGWRAGLDGIASDTRMAVRATIRQPWSSATIVLTLALGLSASTSVFAVFNHVLFRPVAGVADPNGLATVYFQPADRHPTYGSAPREALQALRSAGAFQALGAASEAERPVVARTGSDAEYTTIEFITDQYLEALGVRVRAGRAFRETDFAARQPVAMISERWWHRQFNSDPGAVGRSISINGHAIVLIGVIADYRGWGALRTAQADIWVPLETPLGQQAGSDGLFSLVGRLGPDVSVEIAQQRLQVPFAPYASSRMVMSEGPPRPGTMVPTVYPGLHAIGAGRMRATIGDIYPFALGASGLLLLLACANTANLMLVRTLKRARDLAVRSAIGAGRGRLARGLLIEAVIIVTVAVALGLVFARLLLWGLRDEQLFVAVPAIDDLALDWRVLVFAAALGALTVTLFGLAPALAGSRSGASAALSASPRVTRATTRLRGALVCVQLALALTLLAGAGVLVRSLQNLRSIDLGMNADHVATFSLNPRRLGVSADRQRALIHDTATRLRESPGVESVAFASPSPLSRSFVPARLKVDLADDAAELRVARMVVSADYFRTLQIPVRSGRVLTDADVGPPVRTHGAGVVSESLATQLFGTVAAVGPYGLLQPGGEPLEPRSHDRESLAWSATLEVVSTCVRLVVSSFTSRPSGRPTRRRFSCDRVCSLSRRSTRRAPPVRALEPNLPLAGAGTVRDEIERLVPEDRTLALLTSVVALLAMILGAAGVYAMIAHAVAERRREFGIRMALGATRHAVASTVLRGIAVTSLVGLGLGLAGVFGAARLLDARVYGVSATDPMTLVSACVLLLVVALAGAWLPAWRATRIDPTVALRAE